MATLGLIFFISQFFDSEDGSMTWLALVLIAGAAVAGSLSIPESIARAGSAANSLVTKYTNK